MFPPEIHAELGYYVYRLIDPRDGSTFYIGKGKGDRVFQHVAAAIDYKGDEDEASDKIRTIHQIRNAKLEPIHIIHRHGMTEQEALLVEAALIDFTPGLTNSASGHGSSLAGPAHAAELINRYRTEQMKIDGSHRVLAINIRKTFDEVSVYDAVRCCWRINVTRARNADYIFAVTNGICRRVFVATEWLPATSKNFPGFVHEDNLKRWGFIGEEADEAIQSMYANKKLPEEMKRRKGMVSPILYNYS